MNNLMSKIFKSSLLSSIFFIILGIFLIFESEATIVSISYVVGAIIIALGVMEMLKYFREINSEGKNELDLIYGIICIVFGVVVILHPHAIASFIPIVVGIVIILNSATKLQYSMELKRNNNSLWKTTMILSLIATICGIIIIFNPFSGAVLITRVIGIIIVIYSILDIISSLTIKNTINEIHSAIEEKVEDADIVEEVSEEKGKKDKSRKKAKNKKEKK